MLIQKYLTCIYLSPLFKLNDWEPSNNELIGSFLRYVRLEIYLPRDNIVIAGDMGSDIYLLLEGSAKCYDFEGKEIYSNFWYGLVRGIIIDVFHGGLLRLLFAGT